MIGKMIGVGVLACGASLVSAATIAVDGAYFNWLPSDGGITTGTAINKWDNLSGGSTGAASGTGSWSVGTLGGQTAGILTDNSSERYAQAVKLMPATGATLPTASDFEYYTQFGYYLSDASPRNGTGVLVYREWNTDIKYNPISLLMNPVNQKMTLNGKTLKTSLTSDFLMPLDSWVTFTVHRLSETAYTITAQINGVDTELGWDSAGTFSLQHNAVLLAYDSVNNKNIPGVARYQLGTGMSWTDNAQVGYSFFKVGEAVPEPASVGLLGAGSICMLLRRR